MVKGHTPAIKVTCPQYCKKEATVARLPLIGSDSHQWGALLNEFLRVAHHEDGTLRGVCPVVNVRDFRVAGNQASDDTNAIRAAVAALPQGGGILFFPPGTYKFSGSSPVELSSGAWVLGSGRSSIIQTTGKLTIFVGRGVEGVRVSNLTFQMDMANDITNNFLTAVEFNEGASDVMVDSCKFEALNVPTGDVTLHAVLAKAVGQLWVVNNWISQMQIRMGSEALALNLNVMGPAIIANNHIIKPRNFAISATQFTDAAEMLDLQICNNNIHDPAGQGGIYVGTDNDNRRIKSLKRIVIQGNIITGRWSGEGDTHTPKQSVAILVRPAEVTEQILIAGNVIDKDGDDLVDVMGIKIEATTQPTTLRTLAITHNTIRNTRLWGILVNGDQVASGLVIAHNTLDMTDGLTLRRGNIRDAIIQSNYLNGPGGLNLETVREQDTIAPILVRDNICTNSLGSGITLNAERPNSWISAQVISNTCHDNQQYGVVEIGNPSQFETRYLDNDLRHNTGAGMLVISAAVVRDNWI